MIIHVCFFGLCLMLVPAWLNWQPVSLSAMLLCVGLGPIALLAQDCTIRGYRAAPLSVVGQIDYSWLIFASLLGFVVFGERLGMTTLIGCASIIGGGVMLARAHKA